MFSYIVRRLIIMVPTLFGVTVVSFCVMQLAPGDPVLARLSGGSAGQNTQTADAFLVQKRDLHLDKPLLLNFRYYRDYALDARLAAHYLSLTADEIKAELSDLANDPRSETGIERLRFLQSLAIKDFAGRLANPERWESLAPLIQRAAMVYCQDTGENGVSAMVDVLEHADNPRLKLGAVRCLAAMIPDPFKYTYSAKPRASETSAVEAVWKLWWERNSQRFQPVDPEAKQYLDKKLADMVRSPDDILATIDDISGGDYADVAPRYFAEKLLGSTATDAATNDASKGATNADAATKSDTPSTSDAKPADARNDTALAPDEAFAQKVASSAYLSKVYSHPLVTDVALDAKPDEVDEAARNWAAHFDLYRALYQPSGLAKFGYIFTDTQYAYMIVRLVTFNFGRSTLRTHDPVSHLIWDAFVVSAPLMFFSELLIYLIAVPLGVLCGVLRGTAVDRGISLGLFVLYSVPPFVAGMLFLEYLCFGDYLQWFPMYGLHADNADHLSWGAYALDYLHHAFLPVVCLSLFSLAAIAMYSRSSILDVINQDYIRTARAKGLSQSTVVLKHGLRNALIPILTLFSTFLPAMLGGSVLIEVLFSIPGLGFLGWNSILLKDYPTMMALLYIEAIVTLASFLVTDLLYVLVDPRISFDSRGGSA